MMDKSDFFRVCKRFANLLDRPVKQEQVDELYQSLRFEKFEEVNKAIEQMILDESKLTLSIIKKNIDAQKKLSGSVRAGSHWNGTPCDCDMGLIYTFRTTEDGRKVRYVWRCPKCKAYQAPSILFYNGDDLTI